MANFRKWPKTRFWQKPRLASVWQKLRFCQLYLTTFDQKPPRSRKCRSATVFGVFSKNSEFLTKNPRVAKAERRGRFARVRRSGVFGEIFREILGKFLYAAPRPIFRARTSRARRPKTPARRRLSRASRAKNKIKIFLKYFNFDSRVKARLKQTKAYLRNLKPISYGLCI